MRLLSFAAGRYRSWGLRTDHGIVDLGARLGSWLPDLRSCLEARAAGVGVPLTKFSTADFREEEIAYLPPITRPRKILCVGLNYEDHRIETERPRSAHPALFVRFADSLVGHRQAIVRPRVSEQFDYEAELAVIIGRRARHLPPEQALEAVAGYSCFLDGTMRDWQRHTHQFTPGKNFLRSGAFGPCLVTPEEPGDLSGLAVRCRVNGRLVQNARLGQMIFPVARLISYISSFTELLPGDVIATGTPGGVGARRSPPLFLRPGDRVEVEIDAIGRLENRVVGEEAEEEVRS